VVLDPRLIPNEYISVIHLQSNSTRKKSSLVAEYTSKQNDQMSQKTKLASIHWTRTRSDYSTADAEKACRDFTGVFGTELQSTSPTAACQSPKFPARQRLRSASRRKLNIPRFRSSTFGTLAFSVAGPTVWNSLPDSLRDPAVESERFSAGLENASLCHWTDIRDMSAVLSNLLTLRATFI